MLGSEFLVDSLRLCVRGGIERIAGIAGMARLRANFTQSRGWRGASKSFNLLSLPGCFQSENREASPHDYCRRCVF
jgi:hypothetical protein